MDSRALVQQKIGSQTIGSSFFTVIFLSFRSFPNLSGENPLENKELEDEHQETKVWKQTSQLQRQPCNAFNKMIIDPLVFFTICLSDRYQRNDDRNVSTRVFLTFGTTDVETLVSDSPFLGNF